MRDPKSLSLSPSLSLPLGSGGRRTSAQAARGNAQAARAARRPRARAAGRRPAAISGGVARGGGAEVFQHPLASSSPPCSSPLVLAK